MATIVEIENISKKYLIYHQHRGAYTTLVETLAKQAKDWLCRLRHPLSHKTSKPSCEEFWSLRDISLTINEGDRVGLIGRNGAGKSTLLKILSRITEPTAGKIKIKGRVSSLLEVGTGFHPELTGRENVFLNGAILGMSFREIKRKFDEIVAFAEIDKFLDTPVKQFSSGMYTRLGFAIAAHLDPDLLIVDEVLAVGDIQFQQKCLKKLNDLSSHGRTILFVSHDIGSILALCNKGAFLEKGRLRNFGPIDECLSTYLSSLRTHSLVWEGNTGNEHIRFYKAFLAGSSNGEFFYQNESARLELAYEILKPSPELIFGVEIWNQRNQMIASSHTSHQCQGRHNPHPSGKQQLSFILDTGLFHEGEYRVKLDCLVNSKLKVPLEDIALKLHVYPRMTETRILHPSAKDGITLGHRWDAVL